MAHQGPHQQGAGDPYGSQNAGWGQQPQQPQQPYGGYQAPPPAYQPPPPGAGYPPPYGYPYAPPQRTNGMAIASMVLGILWLYWIGSVLALVFGYIAKKQIRERSETGGGMATAGIVLGWVGVGFLLLFLFLGVASSV